MPYDLYWSGPLSAFFHYAEKTRIEYERKRKELDLKCWLAGSYTREAVLSIYPVLNPMAGKNSKRIDYPEKPRTELAEESKRKSEELQRKETYNQISAWMSAMKGRPHKKRKEAKSDG